MVSQIYHIELQLNMANTFDTEALFSNLDMSITNGIVFELVNCSFLDECSSFPSYGVYISQLIHFARVCSNFGNFNKETFFLNSNYVYTLKSVLKWFRVGL